MKYIRGHSCLFPAIALLLLAASGCDTATDAGPATAEKNDPNGTPEQTAIKLDAEWDRLNSQQQRSIDKLRNNKNYTDEMMIVCTADVEIEVYSETSDEFTLAVWKDKWLQSVDSFSLSGGCGCCVDIYTITGPKAAIEEFPISDSRRQYYPKYRQQSGGG